MPRLIANFARLIPLVAALSLVACATRPVGTPALEEARAAYAALERDGQVAQHAPLELRKAEQSLRLAESFAREGAEGKTIDHHAYLAKQRAAVAREVTNLAMAQRAIQSASAERDRVVLEARGREIDTARSQAEARAREAETARQEAELSRRDAERAQQEAIQATQQARSLQSQIQALQARQTERGLVLTLGDVLFDHDKAQLKAGATRTIQRLVQFLNQYPERKVLVEGFTDSTGAEDYNRRLSEQRANAVRTALLSKGISPDRIEVRGYGKSFAVASNDTPEGRQQNRRVEIVISTGAGAVPERSAL